MKLRRFTPLGLTKFGQYLDQLKAAPTTPPPISWLLSDEDASEPAADIEVVDQSFAVRFDAAKYLDGLLSAAKIANVERDAGLWAWLTLLFFDQVCPVGKNGERSAGETARYMPSIDLSRRYYRHLLLGPWLMFVAHRDDPERLRGLLTSKLDVATAETYRLFIENPALFACKAVVSAATKMYYDYGKGRIRRGAGSKEEGGCRRLIDYLQQLDLTFDLQRMTEPQLLMYLPHEFDRFKPRQLQLI